MEIHIEGQRGCEGKRERILQPNSVSGNPWRKLLVCAVDLCAKNAIYGIALSPSKINKPINKYE